MGAITSILYLNTYKDKSVMGLVLDSPLASLENLIISHVQKKLSIPSLILKAAIGVLNM